METSIVTEWRKKGLTYKDISKELQQAYPDTKGFSERSVRRFCKENGIEKMNETEVDEVVEEAVKEVGQTYGRTMIKGLLDSKGIFIRDKKIAESLQRVNPVAYDQRRHNTLDRTNPVPYHASSFGHKLHLDQNEKLAMFGVTHVLAVDGYSGMIVAHTIMPIKNNLLIYEYIYRKAALTHGLWEQIRVDCGLEFVLTLYVQQKLRQQYGSSDIPPFAQTPSTQNLTVERLWPEVNARVNYPLKRALYALQERHIINMSCPTMKFCVSQVLAQTAAVGMLRFVSAWNSHFIAGKGVPLQLIQPSYAIQFVQSDLPEMGAAADEYEQQGGSLTRQNIFGVDPLNGRDDLIRMRDQRFQSDVGSFEEIFTDVISNDGNLLEHAIRTFLSLTDRFSQLL